jgi:hypothetical protein
VIGERVNKAFVLLGGCITLVVCYRCFGTTCQSRRVKQSKRATYFHVFSVIYWKLCVSEMSVECAFSPKCFTAFHITVSHPHRRVPPFLMFRAHVVFKHLLPFYTFKRKLFRYLIFFPHCCTVHVDTITILLFHPMYNLYILTILKSHINPYPGNVENTVN